MGAFFPAPVKPKSWALFRAAHRDTDSSVDFVSSGDSQYFDIDQWEKIDGSDDIFVDSGEVEVSVSKTYRARFSMQMRRGSAKDYRVSIQGALLGDPFTLATGWSTFTGRTVVDIAAGLTASLRVANGTSNTGTLEMRNLFLELQEV